MVKKFSPEKRDDLKIDEKKSKDSQKFNNLSFSDSGSVCYCKIALFF